MQKQLYLQPLYATLLVHKLAISKKSFWSRSGHTHPAAPLPQLSCWVFLIQTPNCRCKSLCPLQTPWKSLHWVHDPSSQSPKAISVCHQWTSRKGRDWVVISGEWVKIEKDQVEWSSSYLRSHRWNSLQTREFLRPRNME